MTENGQPYCVWASTPEFEERKYTFAYREDAEMFAAERERAYGCLGCKYVVCSSSEQNPFLKKKIKRAKPSISKKKRRERKLRRLAKRKPV